MFYQDSGLEDPYNPICRDHGLDPRDRDGGLLSGPMQRVLPDLVAGFCFVFLRQSLTNVVQLIWNL